MAVGRRETDAGQLLLTQRLAYRPYQPTGQKRPPLHRRPPWLTLLILTVACRTATSAYPALGLVHDDALTLIGRLIWPGLACLSALAIIDQPRDQRRYPALPLLAIIGIVALSTTWSADVPRTLYQSVVLVSIAICCTYVASHHTAEQCLVVVAGYLAGVCALNAFTAATHLSKPLYRGGMMEHKNLIGALAAAAVLTTLLASRVLEGRQRQAMRVGCLVTIYVMAFCQSKSGLFSLAAASIVALLIHVRRRLPGNLLAAVVLFSLLTAALTFRIVGGVEGILNASGKDLTLTGRTEIWHYVLDLAARRPTFGWGYFAIWGERALDGSGTPAYVQLGIRSSHSGYIEMYAGVGIVGLAVLLTSLALLVRWAYHRSHTAAPVGLWALAICVFAVVQNASESVVPGTVQTMIFAFLIIATAVTRPPARIRRGRWAHAGTR